MKRVWGMIEKVKPKFDVQDMGEYDYEEEIDREGEQEVEMM